MAESKGGTEKDWFNAAIGVAAGVGKATYPSMVAWQETQQLQVEAAAQWIVEHKDDSTFNSAPSRGSLEFLYAMGFKPTLCREAMVTTLGDVTAAARLLLEAVATTEEAADATIEVAQARHALEAAVEASAAAAAVEVPAAVAIEVAAAAAAVEAAPAAAAVEAAAAAAVEAAAATAAVEAAPAAADVETAAEVTALALVVAAPLNALEKQSETRSDSAASCSQLQPAAAQRQTARRGVWPPSWPNGRPNRTI